MTDPQPNTADEVTCAHCGQPTDRPVRVSIVARGAERERIACPEHVRDVAVGPDFYVVVIAAALAAT